MNIEYYPMFSDICQGRAQGGPNVRRTALDAVRLPILVIERARFLKKSAMKSVIFTKYLYLPERETAGKRFCLCVCQGERDAE